MAAKTIYVLGGFIRKEVVATGNVTPGHLILMTGAVHATAQGNAQKRFAIENDLVGDGIDVVYASGDTIQYGIFEPGSEVNALLADTEDVAVGAALASAGDGELIEHVDDAASPTPDSAIVAYARTALNNTSGSAARLIVEVA